MNGRKKKPKESMRAELGYKVGYAKPPKDTRFKPGQSGNPRGRPKGSRNKLPELNEERLKDIIREEAYRGVVVREEERTVTMPIAQAVLRSISVKAAKGQYQSQRLFVELLGKTEREDRQLYDHWLETAINYKAFWERELRRRKEFNITGLPEPLPHPDHIEFDFEKGTACIVGPWTKEEKAELDQLIDDKPILLERLGVTHKAIEAATKNTERKKLTKQFNEQLELIGLINKLAQTVE